MILLKWFSLSPHLGRVWWAFYKAQAIVPLYFHVRIVGKS
jgi:hypothetical protein